MTPNRMPGHRNSPLLKNPVVVTIIIAAALMPVAAAGPTTPQQPARPTRMTTVEGITEYALDNGLQVLLFPDQSKPTVTVNITYKVGSRHEGRGEAGMAHLLEHMVFKGTPTFANIWGALEDHGASFNGTTWVDRTNYFETLPANNENLEFALHMEADRMVNSLIRGEDLATEMTVVRNEFEMGENNPVGILDERMMSAAFLWHNYGQSTIGNRSDIERVPVEKLQRFYRNYYQPDNATLVVAGKFDVDHALQLITRYFGAIPRPSRVLEDTYTEEPPQDGPRLVTLQRRGDVAAAGLVYHIPAAAHPDYPALQILEGVLTDRPSGRLYKALVETGAAANISGSAYGWAEPGVMQFMAQVRLDQDARQVLTDMIAVVEGSGAADISAEQVERIRNQMLKNIKLGMNDSGRIGIRLSDAVAQGDWRLFFLQRDRLKSVTTDDVRRVAAHYLVEGNRTAGLFIPAPQPTRATIPPTPAVADLVRDYHGSEDIAAGEEFIATPQSIEQRVARVTLPSGIKLAMLPKETRGDAVNARFVFHIGSESTLKGQAAALQMIPAMLMRGTTRLNHQQLRDEIDRLQSRIMIGSGGGRRGGASDALGTVSASIESDRAHLASAIELLGEMMQQPAMAPAEFETIMTQRLAQSEQRLQDPRAQAMNAMSRALNPWPADSIHYVPTLEERIEQLRSVSPGAVKDLHSRLYGADNLCVAIVGDFDPETIAGTVGKVFGAWKSQSGYQRVAQAYRPYQAEELIIQTPDKEMAMVGMGAAFEMRDDDPDYPALTFAAYVLGQSAKSRLINRLRHQGGLSYGAGAAMRASSEDVRASISGSAICAPQNAVQAGAAMREEITNWISNGITAEELQEGKNSYALKFENSLANDRFVIGQLAAGLDIGRTFEYQENLLGRIAALSLPDIQQALHRQLSNVLWVQVRAGDLSPAGGSESAADTPASEAGSTTTGSSALPERMARFDTNGDGRIQKDEAPPRMQGFFERIDTNGDGALDVDELRAMRGQRRGPRAPDDDAEE